MAADPVSGIHVRHHGFLLSVQVYECVVIITGCLYCVFVCVSVCLSMYFHLFCETLPTLGLRHVSSSVRDPNPFDSFQATQRNSNSSTCPSPKQEHLLVWLLDSCSWSRLVPKEVGRGLASPPGPLPSKGSAHREGNGSPGEHSLLCSTPTLRNTREGKMFLWAEPKEKERSSLFSLA